ncbi:MAG: outer membrane beta-barrel protein [Acidobacteriota bacterium]
MRITPPLLLCGVLLAPALANAQGVATDEQEKPARFQFGPLGLTPRIALKDVGVDTNPQNRPDATGRDLTATLVPGVDSSLRLGRGRLSGKTSIEYLYFDKSTTQRSFNVNQEVRAELRLNRVVPYAAGAIVRTRQRPNLEIDLRVQQHARSAGAGAQLLLGSRTRLDLEGKRSSFKYDEGSFGDASIGQALNRDSDLASVVARFALTPLTTFVLTTETVRDRFEFSPIRDSDSINVLPGFEFKPSALISGKVSVGYRGLAALDSRVPDFAGLIGDVDVQYVFREATQFAMSATRNIEYSIDDEQPYFVANGGMLQVTQMLGLNWFLTGRAGRTRLSYRNFVAALSPTSQPIGRNDRVDLYGIGFGRRLGEDVRIGFDLNRMQRNSTVARRRYEGYRVGVSISYGS